MHLSKTIFLSKFFSGQILLTDKLKLPDPTKVLKKMPAFSILILRHIEPDKLPSIKRICRERRIFFSISQDYYMAQKVKADGLHIKERDMNLGITKLSNNKNMIHSVACHSMKSAIKAQRLGYDFILYSPIFNSSTYKKNQKHNIGMGVVKFNMQTRFLKIPVVALGGIQKKKLNQLNKLNIIGFSAIEFFRIEEENHGVEAKILL